MRILFVKRAVNTRLRNQALTLADLGHDVALMLEVEMSRGYNGPGQWEEDALATSVSVHASPPLNGRGQTGNRSAFSAALRRVAARWRPDIVVAGNDAILHDDERARLVIEQLSRSVPVVYDCQDISSDCFGDAYTAWLERFVAEHAHGVIYTNPLALDWAGAHYHLRDAITFSNFACARDFKHPLPRMSAADGGCHLVYCGSVQLTPAGEPFPWARDLRNLFGEIAALGHTLHLHLGLYAGTPVYHHYAGLARLPNVNLHPYLGFGHMMQQLSTYDAGLILYDFGGWKAEVERDGPAVIDNSFWSRLDTLKQYEYTLAGLPVLASPAQWIGHWLTVNDFGITIDSVPGIDAGIHGAEHESRLRSVRDHALDFAMENRIHELTAFLERVAGR